MNRPNLTRDFDTAPDFGISNRLQGSRAGRIGTSNLQPLNHPLAPLEAGAKRAVGTARATQACLTRQIGAAISASAAFGPYCPRRTRRGRTSANRRPTPGPLPVRPRFPRTGLPTTRPDLLP